MGSEEYQKRKEQIRAYRKTPQGKAAVYATIRRARAKYPERHAARRIVQMRIFRGTMKRQSCERCGTPNAQAHHDDYTKPLAVRWLFPIHHAKAHQ